MSTITCRIVRPDPSETLVLALAIDSYTLGRLRNPALPLGFAFTGRGRSPHEEAAFAPALPAAPGQRLLVVLGGVRALQCAVDRLADLRELAYLLRGQRVEDGAAYGLDMAGGRTFQ